MSGSARRSVRRSICTSDTLFIFGGIDMLISTVFVKYLGQRGVKMFSERLVSFHSRKTLDNVKSGQILFDACNAIKPQRLQEHGILHSIDIFNSTRDVS